MKKSLELKLLNMCENILPQTKLRSDTKLLALLKEIKKRTGVLMYTAWFQEELNMNHEPSLNHWARVMADEDIKNGEETYWDYAYEQAWHWLDSEYNYNYEYRGSVY